MRVAEYIVAFRADVAAKMTVRAASKCPKGTSRPTASPNAFSRCAASHSQAGTSTPLTDPIKAKATAT